MILSERVLAVAIGSLALLGIVAGAALLLVPRTQAQQAATALAKFGKPGDLVLVCPDQIGPSVRRLAPDDLTYYAVPTFTDPARVDWVDYKARNSPPIRRASPAGRSRRRARGGTSSWSTPRATRATSSCAPGMRQELRTLRPTGAHGYFLQKPDLEGMEVDVFPAQPARPPSGR